MVVKAAAAMTLSALCQMQENLSALREPGVNLVSICEAVVSNLDRGGGMGVGVGGGEGRGVGGGGGGNGSSTLVQQQSNEEGVYARRTAEILQKLKLEV